MFISVSLCICSFVYKFVFEFSCDDLCVIFVYMHEELAVKIHDNVFVFHCFMFCFVTFVGYCCTFIFLILLLELLIILVS